MFAEHFDRIPETVCAMTAPTATLINLVYLHYTLTHLNCHVLSLSLTDTNTSTHMLYTHQNACHPDPPSHIQAQADMVRAVTINLQTCSPPSQRQMCRHRSPINSRSVGNAEIF